MAYIYVALVDTPGVFAYAIRRYLKQKYIHVVLSLDADLKEAYSFGRRNPSVPLIAGFEKEDKEKILQAFPTAEYRICRLQCTLEQRERIRWRLNRDYEQRMQLHYAVCGLPSLLLGKVFSGRNQFTCSSYLAKVLEDCGMSVFKKHFSLVTPKDVYEYQGLEVLFEGRLSDLMGRTGQCKTGVNGIYGQQEKIGTGGDLVCGNYAADMARGICRAGYL